MKPASARVPVWRARRDSNSRTGIIIAGVADDHGYIIDDLSGRMAPHEWATCAVEAYRRWRADRIVAEVNAGGDMVQATLRTVDANIPFTAVHASRGKVIRAEPVAALYEQRKVHHVGSLSVLEDQLCGFTSDFDRARADFSPDRLDALVWALNDLMVRTWVSSNLVGICGPFLGCFSGPRGGYPGSYTSEDAAYAASRGGSSFGGGGGNVIGLLGNGVRRPARAVNDSAPIEKEKELASEERINQLRRLIEDYEAKAKNCSADQRGDLDHANAKAKDEISSIERELR